MSKPNENTRHRIDQNPLHPERKLVTRRDFLSSGLMGFSAAVMLPSVFDLVFLEKAARAGDCPTALVAPGMIPFLIFDCAGGAGLSGNWVVSDSEGINGQPLPSYSKLGLGDGNGKFVPDYRFGAPMAAALPAPNTDLVSKIFEALTNPMLLPQAAQDCLRMGIIAHTSLSDSQTNALSAVSLVTAAGMQGSRIRNGLGMRQSPSAGNSDAASLNPAYRPMGISSIDSLSTALSYGPAFKLLPQGMRDALAKALIKLSGSQASKLSSMRLGEQFAALTQCGLVKNLDYTGDIGGIDARGDQDALGIYKITAQTSASNRDALIATLVKNSIEGNSGPSVISIGGCDYHSGNRTDGDTKDAEIGKEIARALALAFAKGKKVAFQIFTDGGIYSDDGTRNWRGDDNDKSLSIFGVLDPTGGGHEMVSQQIGRYTTGQGADRNHFLGTDPVRVAHSVFLNYLAVCGQKGRYAEVARDNPLPLDRLDALTLFANKA